MDKSETVTPTPFRQECCKAKDPGLGSGEPDWPCWVAFPDPGDGHIVNWSVCDDARHKPWVVG
jgi:hypothetical protein